MENSLVFIICLILMGIGVLGLFIPGIPGLGLIFFTAFGYAIFTGFNNISLGLIFLFAVLTLIGILAEYLCSLFSAKKFGATKYGICGALAGGILGLILGSLPGSLIGQFIGVLIGELYFGKTANMSLRAGFGVFVGFLFGTIVQILVATIIIFIFFFKVVFY